MRPRGIRGELVVRSQTDVPGRLKELASAQLRLKDGSDVPVEIEEAWEHKGDWVLKFAGIDSIEAADRFRGADLWVSAAERGALPEGEFFESDLIGCSLVEKASGKVLGSVAGLVQYGGPSLIEAMINGREVLIPFVPLLCEVDLAARTIHLDLPDGLLEL